MRSIFVDTSAWLAVTDRAQPYHREAVAFQRSIGPQVLRITTWGVVSETYTWLRYHTGYRPAESWLDLSRMLESHGLLEVVYPTSAIDTIIRNVLGRFSDQGLSYVDALSLAVVQTRARIDAIFAFDHHLTLGGIPVLPGRLSFPSR